MHISNDATVLIVGAGAAGLTLAIELARRGVSFRLIEKNDGPFPGSRGKGIQPRTQEIFEAMGILDRVVAAGSAYPPQREYHADGTYQDTQIMEQRSPTPGEPYTAPLLVSQSTTERTMHERLAELGCRAEFRTELVQFEQDADGVTATVMTPDGPRRLRVRYLVGTDGGRSTVRKALRIDFPGKTLGVRAVAADIVLSGLSRDVWHRFNPRDNDNQLALCPLPGGELFQLQAPVPREGEIDLSARALRAMIVERSGDHAVEVHDVRWASAYVMNARLADRYRVDNVFIAGDAAHVHPPTGGQGLNTSVQDAYNLGWKLAAVVHGAPPTLLDTYEEERRPIAASVLGLSQALLHAMQRGSLQRGRETQQLDLGYPTSSLCLGACKGGLEPGARAPDAVLRGAGGQARRIFELLRGEHWTLLGFEVQAPFTARDGVHVHRIGRGSELIDSDGSFARAYGMSPGSWALVRPDGYIAGRLSSDELARLEAYFTRWLSAQRMSEVA